MTIKYKIKKVRIKTYDGFSMYVNYRIGDIVPSIPKFKDEVIDEFKYFVPDDIVTGCDVFFEKFEL